jgi:hypothetical protein
MPVYPGAPNRANRSSSLTQRAKAEWVSVKVAGANFSDRVPNQSLFFAHTEGRNYRRLQD